MSAELALSAGMDPRGHAKWLRGIEKKHQREEIKAQREKIAKLRGEVKQQTKRRKIARSKQVERCRLARAKVRQVIKDRRVEVRAKLKNEVFELRNEARNRCELRKYEIAQGGASASRRAQDRLKAARQQKRELAAINRVANRKTKSFSTAAERRGEDNDRVERNIEAVDPGLVPLWRKHKKRFKKSPHKSRTEAFLHWAQEEPDEVSAMAANISEGLAAGDIAEMERELAAEQKRLDKLSKTKKPSPEARAKAAIEAAGTLKRAASIGAAEAKRQGGKLTKRQRLRCLNEADLIADGNPLADEDLVSKCEDDLGSNFASDPEFRADVLSSKKKPAKKARAAKSAGEVQAAESRRRADESARFQASGDPFGHKQFRRNEDKRTKPGTAEPRATKHEMFDAEAVGFGLKAPRGTEAKGSKGGAKSPRKKSAAVRTADIFTDQPDAYSLIGNASTFTRGPVTPPAEKTISKAGRPLTRLEKLVFYALAEAEASGRKNASFLLEPEKSAVRSLEKAGLVSALGGEQIPGYDAPELIAVATPAGVTLVRDASLRDTFRIVPPSRATKKAPEFGVTLRRGAGPSGSVTAQGYGDAHVGIEKRGDVFVARTLTEYRDYKTLGGAARFLAKRGLSPTGERLGQDDLNERRRAARRDLRAAIARGEVEHPGKKTAKDTKKPTAAARLSKMKVVTMGMSEEASARLADRLDAELEAEHREATQLLAPERRTPERIAATAAVLKAGRKLVTEVKKGPAKKAPKTKRAGRPLRAYERAVFAILENADRDGRKGSEFSSKPEKLAVRSLEKAGLLTVKKGERNSEGIELLAEPTAAGLALVRDESLRESVRIVPPLEATKKAPAAESDSGKFLPARIDAALKKHKRRPTTFSKAREELWNHLEAAGWKMSAPTLKTPHASDGGLRLWFKPQSVLYSSDQGTAGSALSLRVDPRTDSPESIIEIARNRFAPKGVGRSELMGEGLAKIVQTRAEFEGASSDGISAKISTAAYKKTFKGKPLPSKVEMNLDKLRALVSGAQSAEHRIVRHPMLKDAARHLEAAGDATIRLDPDEPEFWWIVAMTPQGELRWLVDQDNASQASPQAATDQQKRLAEKLAREGYLDINKEGPGHPAWSLSKVDPRIRRERQLEKRRAGMGIQPSQEGNPTLAGYKIARKKFDPYPHAIPDFEHKNLLDRIHTSGAQSRPVPGLTKREGLYLVRMERGNLTEIHARKTDPPDRWIARLTPTGDLLRRVLGGPVKLKTLADIRAGSQLDPAKFAYLTGTVSDGNLTAHQGRKPEETGPTEPPGDTPEAVPVEAGAAPITKEGRRFYVGGNTYPHREKIRALGLKWDRQRQAWWSAREAKAQSAAKLVGDAPPPEKPAGEFVRVSGNTYPAREKLRKLGGKWDAAQKAWLVPSSQIEAANKAVDQVVSRRAKQRPGGGRCRTCSQPVADVPHHRAMDGLCGSCAFDEFDM